jgi:hypothetical protein
MHRTDSNAYNVFLLKERETKCTIQFTLPKPSSERPSAPSFFHIFLILFPHGNFLIVPYRSEDEHELVISFSVGRFFVIMMSKVLINQLLVISFIIWTLEWVRFCLSEKPENKAVTIISLLRYRHLHY